MELLNDIRLLDAVNQFMTHSEHQELGKAAGDLARKLRPLIKTLARDQQARKASGHAPSKEIKALIELLEQVSEVRHILSEAWLVGGGTSCTQGCDPYYDLQPCKRCSE